MEVIYKCISKTVLFFAVFLLTIHDLKPQSLKESAADKCFNQLSFAKAFEYYSELAVKKNASPKNIRRAAECCVNLNEPKKACEFYDRLLKTSDANNEDVYKYSQELKRIGKYEQADEYMQRLFDSHDFSIVTTRHRSYKNYYLDLRRDSSKYKVIEANMNTSENEFSPFIVNDKFYFTSNRKNTGILHNTTGWDDSYFLDIYNGDLIDNVVKNITSLNSKIDSKYHEGPAALSPDGKTMYITRSNYIEKKLVKDSKKQVNLKIYVSKKNDKGEWGELENFPLNNDNYSIGHPAISKDGKLMFFVSDMPGGYGHTDLYLTRLENGVWSKPENLGPVINSEGKELFPYLNEQDVLFFSSDGNAGLGGLDVYYAEPQQGFYFTPQNMGYPINTQYDDFGIFLNKDKRSGYISSNRGGGKGKDDIYRIEFVQPFVTKKVLKGAVIDDNTKEPIAFAKIKISGKNGVVLNELETDDRGRFSVQIPSNENLAIYQKKNGYISKTTLLNYADIPKNEKELLLTKQDFRIKGLVLDVKTKKPLEGVKIQIADLVTNKDGILKITDANGDFNINLNDKKNSDKIKYSINIAKEGFKSKTIIVDQTLSEIQAHPDLILYLGDEFNGELTNESTITFNSIYFDLNKSNIREDAKKELNKIYETLKYHPEITQIEIKSTADCRGSNNYNLKLSKKRAKSTAEYLIKCGVHKNKLKLKWVGENELNSKTCGCEPGSNKNCNEEEHQLNRKSSFSVVKKQLKTIKN